jgi:hypothetical protein
MKSAILAENEGYDILINGEMRTLRLEERLRRGAQSQGPAASPAGPCGNPSPL